MTTNSSGSAKLYSFPPRGRFLVKNAGDDAQSLPPAYRAPAVKIASGSGWYHDDAIAEARQAEARQAEPRRN